MKKLLVLLSAIILLSGCGADAEASSLTVEESSADEVSSSADSEVPEKKTDFVYTVEGENAVIFSYIGSGREAVTVPAEIDGYPSKRYRNELFFGADVKEVTFAEGITDIVLPRGAALEKIFLPSSTEKVTFATVGGYQSITDVSISGNDRYKTKDGVLFTADEKELLYFPNGRTGSYTVPDGTAVIGKLAFSDTKIESITLPKTLVEIKERAFCGSKINALVIPDGVEKIGDMAFMNTALGELKLQRTLTFVGENILGTDRKKATKILAYAPTDATKPLNFYENLSYEKETVLQKAFREGEQLTYNQCYGKIVVVFTDIDDDNFPELFCFDNYQGYCYKYNTETGWNNMFYDPLYSEIKLYRDKENESYFYVETSEVDASTYYICADKITFDENGKTISQNIAESGLFYPIGHYSNASGYLSEFSGIGGTEIHITPYSQEQDNSFCNDDLTAFKNFVEKSLSEYELVKKIDVSEIRKKYYSDSKKADDTRFFYDGTFADEPSSVYNFTANKNKISVKIGDEAYDEYTYYARLKGDEVTPENFEKLSALPCLTSLYVAKDDIDLTGIEKLKGLKSLHIQAEKITGYEQIKQLDSLEWLSISVLDNLDFVAGLDSVKVFETGCTMEKPANYYAPVCKMKNLKYIPVSVWDRNITEVQTEYIEENRPDIALCYYKVG